MEFDYNKNKYMPVVPPQIEITRVGFQEPDPNQNFSRIIRNEYILQYVVSGKGEYNILNKTYKIKKDILFLIPPNIINHYKADKEQPYSYFWFHITGNGVSDLLNKLGLSVDNPVIDMVNPNLIPLFEKLNTYAESNKMHHKFLTISIAYQIISEFLETTFKTNQYDENSNENTYIIKAVSIIKDKYNEDISVDYIADTIGLNRCYFSTLFKKHLKVSPMEYLISYRVKQAAILFKTNLTISEISNICGFNNSSNFSIRFKKYMGVTPMQYRRELSKE
jgi:AraC family transcriptional regulator of arabinose operon